MKINDLLLVNYRSHQNRKFSFRGGVNAIVGKNAAGKTSVIEAIVFALTGSLFKGHKDTAIRAGCDSGHVVMNFVINGKPGRITRYLDVTNVKLEYDDNIYKKAGEVKEVWDKLLQVQPEFIENIITARQGKIHSLFSTDDETAREKLFQKIFLVPPTEKIRSALYRNYMKQCPPAIPVEDPAQLYTIKADKLKDIAELTKLLETFPLEDAARSNELIVRKSFLESCKRDASSIANSLRRKEAVQQSLVTYGEEIEKLTTRLASISIEPFNDEVVRLRKVKVQLDSYNQIIKQLADYPADIEDQAKKAKENCEQAIEQIANASLIEKQITVKLEEIQDWLDGDATIGHKNCPLCKQALDHVHDFNLARIAERDNLVTQLDTAIIEIKAGKEKLRIARMTSASLQDQANTKLNLIEKLKEIEVSSEEIADLVSLAEYEEVVDCYVDETEALDLAQSAYNQLNTELNTLELTLARYAVYDGTTSLEDELEEVLNEIHQVVSNKDSRHTLNVRIQIAKARITELDERLVAAERDNEKNAKRNRYLEVITRIYDGFHSSNFPRKLVQTYTGAVTERLREKMESFDLPFTASINDKFETKIFDKDNNNIPEASGGQQVLLGLALHLALHDLFSQSFPLFMIDEGTTHLDADNVALYFNLVASLKTEKKLNQIIIIDHHASLKEVVDHVIEI